MFVDPGDQAIVVNQQFETEEVALALRSNYFKARLWHGTLV